MSNSAYEKINLKGFLVDFFGILVPGIIFIIFSLFALGWPILIFSENIYKLLFNNSITINFIPCRYYSFSNHFSFIL